MPSPDILGGIIIALFILNGLSYAVGGPSIGIAVQAAETTDQVVPVDGGMIDPPDDSIAPPVQPASTEWMTNIFWNDAYRGYSDAFGGTWGHEHCRQVGSTMLCIRSGVDTQGESTVQELWDRQTKMMLFQLTEFYQSDPNIYWGYLNPKSTIVVWQVPVTTYYMTDESSCGGRCSYLPPVPAGGPNWSRYEFWRVMVEELQGEIMPYIFYQKAAAIVTTPIRYTGTCNQGEAYGNLMCQPEVDAINSGAKIFIAQYPTFNDYKVAALAQREKEIYEGIAGYGDTVTWTDGPEGVGGNVILTKTVPMKDAVVASCDGIYSPYNLGLGCVKTTRFYQTIIRASEGSHTVQTYGGGTTESPDYTGPGASSVVWTVGTDPVGVGSETMVVGAYDSKDVQAVGGRYIGATGGEGTGSQCLQPFREDQRHNCNPSLYRDWHYQVFDTGWSPIGESFVYDVSIQRYWLTHDCYVDGGCFDTIHPFTPAEWSHITIYMNALSLIDKLIFVSWFNTYAGSCAIGAYEGFSAGSPKCWTSDNLNIEEFDKYVKNGDQSIFETRTAGTIINADPTPLGNYFAGAFPICQLLSLKSVAAQRRLYAVGPMTWNPSSCEQHATTICQGLGTKCIVGSRVVGGPAPPAENVPEPKHIFKNALMTLLYSEVTVVLSLVGSTQVYEYTLLNHGYLNEGGTRYYLNCIKDECTVTKVVSGLQYSLLPFTDAIDNRYYVHGRLSSPQMLVPWFSSGYELYIADLWLILLVIGVGLLIVGLRRRRSDSLE